MPLPELQYLDVNKPLQMYYAGRQLRQDQEETALRQQMLQAQAQRQQQQDKMDDNEFRMKVADKSLQNVLLKAKMSISPNASEAEGRKKWAEILGQEAQWYAEMTGDKEGAVPVVHDLAGAEWGAIMQQIHPQNADIQIIDDRYYVDKNNPEAGAKEIKNLPEARPDIERTIDLGGRVKVIYKDGKVEFLEKTTSPSTQTLADTRKVTDTSSLRKEFNENYIAKQYPEVASHVSRAEAVMREAGLIDESGTFKQHVDDDRNLVAIDQALITLMNKMLDPESVVRESEYARTPENISLVNRAKGAFQKLTQGGAGVTDEDRVAIYQVIKLFEKESQKQYEEVGNFYRDIAEKSGLNPEAVVRNIKGYAPVEQDVTKTSSEDLWKILGVE